MFWTSVFLEPYFIKSCLAGITASIKAVFCEKTPVERQQVDVQTLKQLHFLRRFEEKSSRKPPKMETWQETSSEMSLRSSSYMKKKGGKV